LFSKEQCSFLLLDDIGSTNPSLDQPITFLNCVIDKTPLSIIYDQTNSQFPFRIFIAATSNYDPEFSIRNRSLTIFQSPSTIQQIYYSLMEFISSSKREDIFKAIKKN
jgi:hypothetical protein